MEKQGRSEVGFQSLPRPVGFTWKLLYDSGSPTPLKGFVVRGAVHHALSRIFYQMCSYLQPPRRGCGINGVALPNLNPNFAHEEVYTEWASARSRQTTTPTPHRSVFTGRTLFLTPSQQYPSTKGTTKQTRKLNRKSIRHGQQRKQMSEFLTKLE